MVMYIFGVYVAADVFLGGGDEVWILVEEFSEFSAHRADVGGIALVYSLGGGMLVLGVWALLLTLFVVLELTRGLGRGTLRAV